MASVAFTDGPAEGVTLPALRRLPVFLRVVQDAASGKWDALDQLEDEPREGEVVHVYVRRQFGFACRGGPGGGPFATYAHVEVAEGIRRDWCRDSSAWRIYVDVLAHAKPELLPAYEPGHALHG